MTMSNLDFRDVMTLSETLSQNSNIPNLIQVFNQSELNSILNGPIDGVAVDGELRRNIGDFLCERAGAILPILSSRSDPERFFIERTVTNNTTAAGGNATLLTLA